MEDLIKALQIFLKYGNPKYPTHCEHDTLYVDINPIFVSNEDKEKLEELGFKAAKEDDEEFVGGFYSFRYGST